jgi:hypothetical protein
MAPFGVRKIFISFSFSLIGILSAYWLTGCTLTYLRFSMHWTPSPIYYFFNGMQLAIYTRETPGEATQNASALHDDN